jgi:cbb3-type cytochrome oxidase subunit 3
MNFTGLIFLLIAHYITGKGVLKLFKIETGQTEQFCLALITGIPLVSFGPCVLQILKIPITGTSAATITAIIGAICSIPLFINFKKPVLPKLKLPKLYELPALSVCILLILFSIWRCFYFPPYSRDVLSGPELIAEYTVSEHTMINSVFNVDLSTSNNYYKSPYITCLQIIYKLLVTPFGQTWLSILFVAFIIWLYGILKSRIHPILAGVILLLFLCIQEMFAYSFLILYDYSNAVFFFAGFYFLSKFMKSGRENEFIFSAFMFGLATYIRTETLVLIAFILPMLFVHFFRKKESITNNLKQLGVFFVLPFAFYFICMHIFVALFVPIPFNFHEQINPDLGNIGLLTERISGITGGLVFSDISVGLWGYFIYIFLGIFAIDLVWKRKFNLEARLALFGIVLVYFGIAFLGYLIPHVDLYNTSKRSMFKLFPLMLLYLANSDLLLTISGFLNRLEYDQQKKLAK